MTESEKAKAYDEALDRAKDCLKDGTITSTAIDYISTIFPELKESEDEKIRKALVRFHKSTIDIDGIKGANIIAWLEKQGEQDNNEDSNILQRFSFYTYKDEPNILYLAGLYVNKKYRNKGIGTKILEVADEVAKSLNCHAIRLKTKKDSNAERLYRTHGYNNLATEEKDEIWLEKQGEQNPAWSEEDEENLQHCCMAISVDRLHTYEDKQEMEAWLKSLKDRIGG